MLKQRILLTLKFFDLQDTPLTLLELHDFLLPQADVLLRMVDDKGELAQEPSAAQESEHIAIDRLKRCLELECRNEVVSEFGYYAFRGREQIIRDRLANYFYGFKRDKMIRRHIGGLRHIPFVRGAAVLGSQALGMQRAASDIDLLVLVDRDFMGLARLLVTIYFQLLGNRRHGTKVANRFCLNHYVVAGKRLNFDRNLYTASEYLKMRTLVYPKCGADFQHINRDWLSCLFPNSRIMHRPQDEQSVFQRAAEKLLSGGFGRWCERQVKRAQYRRINRGEFIVVSEDELSFHPNNRKRQLFEKFFIYAKQQAAVWPAAAPVITNTIVSS